MTALIRTMPEKGASMEFQQKLVPEAKVSSML
jgi:hypothetical protein